jgi:hypothetical protein
MRNPSGMSSVSVLAIYDSTIANHMGPFQANTMRQPNPVNTQLYIVIIFIGINSSSSPPSSSTLPLAIPLSSVFE